MEVLVEEIRDQREVHPQVEPEVHPEVEPEVQQEVEPETQHEVEPEVHKPMESKWCLKKQKNVRCVDCDQVCTSRQSHSENCTMKGKYKLKWNGNVRL